MLLNITSLYSHLYSMVFQKEYTLDASADQKVQGSIF